MKKVLLIDDRANRQIDLLKKADIDISFFYEVLDNKIKDEYNLFLKNMEDDSSFLSNYEVIIAHQSIFQCDEKKDLFAKIKNNCKKYGCSLVLFSGGNENSYTNEEYEELTVSSINLYSKNLVLFLNEFRNGNKNVLILSYGKKWKLNIILNILEKITYFIDEHYNDEDIDFDEFKNFTNYELLVNLNVSFYKIKIEDNWTYIQEIIEFRNDILEHIREMTND